MSQSVGSILHGAYGDYYEQMVALRHFKRKHPNVRLHLFFASSLRYSEMSVFDLSFADGVHPPEAIAEIAVDRFLQFQVFDRELQQEILSRLPLSVAAKIDRTRNLKPWQYVRQAWRDDPEICDIGLSSLGQSRLPGCFSNNGIPPDVFRRRFTIGFLWRYRNPGGVISAWGQLPQAELIALRSALFRRLIAEHNAHFLVCGMNVVTTDSNRDRTDNKYTHLALDVPADRVTYLQGLNWGLELEIIRRCPLSLVMASGFSEALWLKRRGQGVVLIDPPYAYLMKLLWNRMPFFGILQPTELLHQLRQPHTVDRMLRYLRRCRLLPAGPRSFLRAVHG